MASFERTDIPAGLSADDAARLMRATGGRAPAPRPRFNGKALRGLVFALLGLSCVVSLPLSPRVVGPLTPGGGTEATGPAGANVTNPYLALALIVVALVGLLFGALAIVDGVFGALEVRGAAGRERGLRLALAAVAIGLGALLLFFWSFYFPESMPL
ncbi:MAG: hypothetical protein ACYTEZ_14600 [Planctomycetota bacterium]